MLIHPKNFGKYATGPNKFLDKYAGNWVDFKLNSIAEQLGRFLRGAFRAASLLEWGQSLNLD